MLVFAKKNNLAKVEPKDVEQASAIRELLKKIPKLEDAVNVVIDNTLKRKQKMQHVP